MDEVNYNSERFWAFMLPITTALTILGTVLANRVANQGEILHQSKMMQSWLLVSLFMGFFSVLGLRAVIYHAIDNGQHRTIKILGGLSMVFCGAYLTYGISTF